LDLLTTLKQLIPAKHVFDETCVFLPALYCFSNLKGPVCFILQVASAFPRLNYKILLKVAKAFYGMVQIYRSKMYTFLIGQTYVDQKSKGELGILNLRTLTNYYWQNEFEDDCIQTTTFRKKINSINTLAHGNEINFHHFLENFKISCDRISK
jgi:hypothetical protein